MGDEKLRALEKLATTFNNNINYSSITTSLQSRVDTIPNVSFQIHKRILPVSQTNNPSQTRVSSLTIPKPSSTKLTTPSILPQIISPTKLTTPSILPKTIPPTKHIIPPTKILKPIIPKHIKQSSLRISRRHKKRNFKYPVIQYLIEKYSTINSHKANLVIDSNTGASFDFRHLRNGKDKKLWDTSFANELGRLINGLGTRMTTGTKLYDFNAKTMFLRTKKTLMVVSLHLFALKNRKDTAIDLLYVEIYLITMVIQTLQQQICQQPKFNLIVLSPLQMQTLQHQTSKTSISTIFYLTVNG